MHLLKSELCDKKSSNETCFLFHIGEPFCSKARRASRKNNEKPDGQITCSKIALTLLKVLVIKINYVVCY